MKTEQQKQTGIKIREVYLSDLKSVLGLYQKDLPLNGKDRETEKLTADFGLPIGVAEQNKKVIACALANINPSGEVAIHIYTEQGVEPAGVFNNLQHFSLTRFNSVWGDQTKVNTRPNVKNAIDRLVNWLNQCN
uniref:hypothetical protein n=1 Tax=Pedobacter schmidteae TaxID=2201271 RepID=UPI000EB44BBA|nr:hypothetical protein [Pedobacter schmidteae]